MTVCHKEINNIEDCVDLKLDIDKLGESATFWGMGFQPTKCNTVALTRKRKPVKYNSS